ncbi:MAG: hypothetical protein AAFV62_09450 [Pseudomonadota bacterium]
MTVIRSIRHESQSTAARILAGCLMLALVLAPGLPALAGTLDPAARLVWCGGGAGGPGQTTPAPSDSAVCALVCAVHDVSALPPPEHSVAPHPHLRIEPPCAVPIISALTLQVRARAPPYRVVRPLYP